MSEGDTLPIPPVYLCVQMCVRRWETGRRTYLSLLPHAYSPPPTLHSINFSKVLMRKEIKGKKMCA